MLSQVSCRIRPLLPTISFTVETQPSKPQEPHIHCGPVLPIPARDLLIYTPGMLHRVLLFRHIRLLVTSASEPVTLATVSEQCPDSSTFAQIRQALNSLVICGMLTRPARGYYAAPQRKAG